MALIALWILFAVVFGLVVFGVVRAKNPRAPWFESGLFGTIAGAIIFLFLWIMLFIAGAFVP